ncbi:hypothetical protein V1525DRAFT_435582 [Lipomyces kononenkoae]|uniref:Uncharacterized protein n=1 Tax=Lipomyces kononenkoae TaxID=34357 RepID=A0ACC3SSC3_LIPKO
MPSAAFLAKPHDGFSAVGIARGFQLTILGAYRALQNPDLLKGKYYKQAAYAIAISLIIQFIISVPLWIVKVLVSIVARIFASQGDNEASERSTQVVNGISFIQGYVINLSGLLIGLMRYLRPEMDDMFMESLRFIDKVYFKMHPERAIISSEAITQDNTAITQIENGTTSVPARFYTPLSLYATSSARILSASRVPSANTSAEKEHAPMPNNAAKFVSRYFRRSILSLTIYFLSLIPYLGKIVLQIVSFYSFRKTVGVGPAVLVFGVAAFMPKSWLTIFLASYWGSRSLVRELLIPYFSRIPFTPKQRESWFRAREGVLFGFGFGFYFILKIPYVGVLLYGIAEASAAYLVTKVTDPPPPPTKVLDWTETQTQWKIPSGDFLQSEGFIPLMGTRPGVPGGWTETEKKND